MSIALITLSSPGLQLALRLQGELPQADLYVHRIVSEKVTVPVKRFSAMANLSKRIFNRYNGLVYIAPCGAVVRVIAPLLVSKKTDPAVVVVDAGAHHAISLLSGHEGGANLLTFQVANILGIDPVISTTTEVVKDLIVGIGCRRGTPSGTIIQAIQDALVKVKLSLNRVRVLASADVKKDEVGLIEAARELDVFLRFIPSSEILSSTRAFRHSTFVKKKVGLPAVAEPSALLAGKRTVCILHKTILHGVTVAIARENCMS